MSVGCRRVSIRLVAQLQPQATNGNLLVGNVFDVWIRRIPNINEAAFTTRARPALI